MRSNWSYPPPDHSLRHGRGVNNFTSITANFISVLSGSRLIDLSFSFERALRRSERIRRFIGFACECQVSSIGHTFLLLLAGITLEAAMDLTPSSNHLLFAFSGGLFFICNWLRFEIHGFIVLFPQESVLSK